MKLILLQRVEKLGKLGDTVTVKRGYGVNYLLSKGIALRATDENLKKFEAEKANLEALDLKHKDEAEAFCKKIDNKEIILIRQAGESGQLFGSVSARDIAEEMNDSHIKKNQIRIERPIKEIGIHPVRIQPHPDVSATILINVAKSTDEAKAQAETAKETIADSAAQPVE